MAQNCSASLEDACEGVDILVGGCVTEWVSEWFCEQAIYFIRDASDISCLRNVLKYSFLIVCSTTAFHSFCGMGKSSESL